MDDVERQLLDLLRRINQGVFAVALSSLGEDYWKVLAVVEDFKGGFQRRWVKLGERKLEVLFIDKELLESDVLESALLEAVAWRLLLPYRGIMGGEYLDKLVRRYRYKKVRESLSGLVLEHPMLSTELFIDPKYFIADILLRLSYEHLPSLLQRLEEDLSLAGYEEVIRDLERDGLIFRVDGHFKVDPGFAESVKMRFPLPNYITEAHRLMRKALKRGPSWVRSLFQLLLQKPLESLPVISPGRIEVQGAERYVYYPTASGLTPLAGALDLPSILSSLEGSEVEELRIQRYGSILNEVYLLTYHSGGGSRRVIMKRYPSWTSIKWAPIFLWTIGTRNFSVLGRTRMERECAMTSLLRRNGVLTPQILQAIFREQLILREYVDGENLAEPVKRVIKGVAGGNELEMIRRAGSLVAAVHRVGAILGDCKPENFIMAGNVPVLVDLEQGGRSEERAWDLAEFIYYSGHYANPLDPAANVVKVSESFIEGYLEGGGEVEDVGEASRLKYAKVFTPIVLPHILLAISRSCRSRIGRNNPR